MSLERAYPEHAHCVYLLASSRRGALYLGVTSDLPRSSGRDGGRGLVWFEAHADIHAALRREKTLRGWGRARMVAFVDRFNPQWRDLAAGLAAAQRRGADRRGRAARQ